MGQCDIMLRGHIAASCFGIYLIYSDSLQMQLHVDEII